MSGPRRRLAAACERLGRPVDAASLSAFRIAFGALMLAGTLRFAARGWIHDLYVAPPLHFHYWGFGFVEPLPPAGMVAAFVALGGLSLLIAVGVATRAALAAFFVVFTYVELIDKATYLNHYYFVSVLSLLMIALPLDRAWSITAWRARRRGRPIAPVVPAWAVAAVRLQLGLVYFFAGVAKLRPDWLLEAQPLRLWLAARADLPLVGPWLRLPEVAYAMSWAGAIFDLSAPFLLLWPRARPLALAAVVVFHGLTGLLFPAIGMFPWIMALSALIFLPPGWPRALGRRLGITGPERPVPRDMSTRTALPRALAAALALHFALQLGLPLRRLAYPGDTAWTEEGFRFAWQVMLVEKVGMVTYRVRDRASGRERRVDPEPRLSAQQAKQMAIAPDMILEYAHWIAAEEAAQGRDVEVRADAFVTYNGRPSARLLDPEVDLARERDGLAAKPWILPAPPR
ncbi:MAG: HTTM domain-containing protein [Nannocystaceae bacterium]